MAKLRKGDIVSFKAVVTDVAPFPTKENPNQTQIMANILPNGKHLGWCLPDENAFEVVEQRPRQSDKVYYGQNYVSVFNLIMIDDHQVILKEESSGHLKVGFLNECTRIS